MSAADDIQFRASVDKTVMDKSQYFTLTLEADGSVTKLSDPRLPDLSDFRILSGPNESSSIQIINGRYSSTKSWSYVIRPLKSGELTIGSAEISYKRETYKTEPITITVIDQSSTPPTTTRKGSSTPQRSSSEPPELFVQVTADKTNPYQNEQVILTYTIYTRVTVNSYEISRLPATPGFWSEEFEIPNPPVVQDEVIQGHHYRKALVRRVAVFPTKAGKLTIDPLEVTSQVQVEDTRRRNDPFDRFFSSPFMNQRTEERFIETEPLTLEVKPLPLKNRPDNFAGAVGDFSLDVILDRTSVKTNEAMTLTVRYSGSGNIKLLEEPDLLFPADFEAYDPQSSVDIKRSGSRIYGTKTLEYVLIPRIPGVGEIPAIEFSYFNPADQSYHTLSHDGMEVQIERGVGVMASSVPGITKEEVRLIGEDIQYLKSPGRLSRLSHPHAIPKGYWAGIVLPPILLLGLWSAARLRGAPTLKAKRQNRRIYAIAQNDFRAIQKRLNSADTTGKAAELYGQIHNALLHYLGSKLQVPASGLKEDEVLRKVQQSKLSEGLIRDLQEIFSDCNTARFAAVAADQSHLQRTFKRAQKAVSSIELQISNGASKSGVGFMMIVAVLLSFWIAPLSQAQELSLERAEELYRNGDYTAAAEIYEKIIDNEGSNGEIYYNLGNCNYKLDQIGKAILNYERALPYLGRDEDLDKNLKIANLKTLDRIEPLPRLFVIELLIGFSELFTVRGWAGWFIFFEWLVAIQLILIYILHKPSWRRLAARAFIICALLMLLTGVVFLQQSISKANLTEAIIMVDNAEVMSAPDNASTELFTIHEGSKLIILRRVSGWAEIKLADGKQGWLPQTSFEII
ncbi:BatD family protein [bacterium]|nr:BatD family protein [bacterium]MBU1652739.1 BatD family protein [bacterium]